MFRSLHEGLMSGWSDSFRYRGFWIGVVAMILVDVEIVCPGTKGALRFDDCHFVAG